MKGRASALSKGSPISVVLHEPYRVDNVFIPTGICGNYPVKHLRLVAAAISSCIAYHPVGYLPSSEPPPFDSNYPGGCTSLCPFLDQFVSSSLVKNPPLSNP